MGEFVRVTHRWGRRIGKLLPRTLLPETLNMPLAHGDDREDIVSNSTHNLAKELNHD